MKRSEGRLLGIDVGEKRVGIAVSDDRQTIASPILAIQRGPDDVAELRRIVIEYSIAEIVVGLPTGLSGREGPQATDVRDYAALIAAALELDLSFWDERLTSVQAERSLIEAGHSRKKRRTLIDSVAASLMLQSFLDAKSARY